MDTVIERQNKEGKDMVDRSFKSSVERYHPREKVWEKYHELKNFYEQHRQWRRLESLESLQKTLHHMTRVPHGFKFQWQLNSYLKQRDADCTKAMMILRRIEGGPC